MVIDVPGGGTFTFPTPLRTAYAMSRDAADVLGGVGRDVVVEHRDGTLDVLATDADSASWSR